MKKEKLIDKIFIRATNTEGKWGSFSLAELAEMNCGGQAMNWLLGKLCGYEQGVVIDKEQLEKLAKLLKKGSYVKLSSYVKLI